jgi:hypothetical protein
MTPRTNLTVNELCEILNANPQGCNQYGCKAGIGKSTVSRGGRVHPSLKRASDRAKAASAAAKSAVRGWKQSGVFGAGDAAGAHDEAHAAHRDAAMSAKLHRNPELRAFHEKAAAFHKKASAKIG